MSKTQVLFVDDDERLISGLRRMLYDQRGEWEMHFCSSGADAMEVIQSKAIDVIVSDMRMPGMNGAELLGKVQAASPGTTRFIISGYAELETVIKTVGPSHQYIAKPCDPETLKKSIHLSCRLKSYIGNNELRTHIASISSLPVSDQTIQNMAEKFNAKEPDLSAISSITENDACLAVQLLKLTNSSYFSISPNISRIGEAVRFLGVEVLQNLMQSENYLVGANLPEDLHRAFEGDLNTQQLRGRLAAKICETAGLAGTEVDLAFTAGLLSDIGTNIFLSYDAKKYRTLNTLLGDGALNKEEAEKQIFNETSADAGAYLLGLWGFTEEFIGTAISLKPSTEIEKKITPKTAVEIATAVIEAARGERSAEMNRQDEKMEVLQSSGCLSSEDRVLYGKLFLELTRGTTS